MNKLTEQELKYTIALIGASGKFKARYNNRQFNIGLDNIGEGYFIEFFPEYAECIFYWDECTILCRSIESMTDEEVKGFCNSYRENRFNEGISFWRTIESLKEAIKSAKSFSYQELFYLFSIGVSPEIEGLNQEFV